MLYIIDNLRKIKDKKILKLTFIKFNKINNELIYNLKINDENHEVIMDLLMYKLSSDVRNKSRDLDYKIIHKWKNIKDNLYEIKLILWIPLSCKTIYYIPKIQIKKSILIINIISINSIKNKEFKSIFKSKLNKLKKMYKKLKHDTIPFNKFIEHFSDNTFISKYESTYFNFNLFDISKIKNLLYYNIFTIKINDMIYNNEFSKKEIDTIFNNIEDLYLVNNEYSELYYSSQLIRMHQSTSYQTAIKLIHEKQVNNLMKLVKSLIPMYDETKNLYAILTGILYQMIKNNYKKTIIYNVYNLMLDQIELSSMYGTSYIKFMFNSLFILFYNDILKNHDIKLIFNNIFIQKHIDVSIIDLTLLFIHTFKSKLKKSQIKYIIDNLIIKFDKDIGTLNKLSKHHLYSLFVDGYDKQFNYKCLNPKNSFANFYSLYLFNKIVGYLDIEINKGKFKNSNDELIKILQENKIDNYDMLVFFIIINDPIINQNIVNYIYEKYNLPTITPYLPKDVVIRQHKINIYIFNYNKKLYKFLKFLIDKKYNDLLNNYLDEWNGFCYVNIDTLDDKYIILIDLIDNNYNNYIRRNFTFYKMTKDSIDYNNSFDRYRKCNISNIVDDYINTKLLYLNEFNYNINYKFRTLFNLDHDTNFFSKSIQLDNIDRSLDVNVKMVKLWVYYKMHNIRFPKKMSLYRYILDSNINLCDKKYNKYRIETFELMEVLFYNSMKNYMSYNSYSSFNTFASMLLQKIYDELLILINLLHLHTDFDKFMEMNIKYYENLKSKKMNKAKIDEMNELYIKFLKSYFELKIIYEYLDSINEQLSISWKNRIKLEKAKTDFI